MTRQRTTGRGSYRGLFRPCVAEILSLHAQGLSYEKIGKQVSVPRPNDLYGPAHPLGSQVRYIIQCELGELPAKQRQQAQAVSERRARIFAMREAGRGFASIGGELGISSGRVRDIIISAPERRREGDPPELASLTARARNALFNYFSGTLPPLIFIADQLDWETLAAQPMVGAATLSEIKDWIIRTAPRPPRS